MKKFIATWIENNERVGLSYTNAQDLLHAIYPVLAKGVVVELRYE